jgi:uncharacterized sodium:solute symporter family permease YidK
MLEGLTYITEQQINELIKSHRKLMAAKKECVIFSLIVVIGMFLYFAPQILKQNNEYTYIFILLGAIFNGSVVSSYLNIYSKRFEKNKESMVKVISGQFCKHDDKTKCSCKDTLAKYLYEEEKINIIF